MNEEEGIAVAWLATHLPTIKPPPRTRRKRRTLAPCMWSDVAGDLSAKEFVRYYRLTREEFDELHKQVTAKVPGYFGLRNTRANSRVRLASTLRFLAGGAARDVARIHGMRRPSFYVQFHETVDAIVAALPSTEEPFRALLAERSTTGSLQNDAKLAAAYANVPALCSALPGRQVWRSL